MSAVPATTEASIDVWWLSTESPAADALIADGDSVLSAAERARRDDALTVEARRERALSRTLLRTLLASYTGRVARELQFSDGEHGRPELANCAVPVRFSVSHTAGALAIAVTRSLELGIDVEAIGEGAPPVGVAQLYFSPAEIDDLAATPPADQRARFFAYWTLKEAYAKARGLGFALPMRAIELSLGERIDLRLAAAIDDDAGSWQFRRLSPSPHHTLAIACRSDAALSIALRDLSHHRPRANQCPFSRSVSTSSISS